MSLREHYDGFVIRNTPDCHEAVRIHSHSLDGFVSPWKRVLVHWHSGSCLYCARYFRQLRDIHALLRNLPNAEPEADELADRVKTRVRRRLDQAEDGDAPGPSTGI